jgi:hypothetical protein
MVEARVRSDRQRHSEASDSTRPVVPSVEFASRDDADAIAKRAYELYQHRGGEHGHDFGRLVSRRT